jgi:hypothetical protein
MFTLGSFPDPLKRPAEPSDVIAGGYTMIPQKFYHPNAGRHALGLIGGNEVSLITGNMVDLESDLRNITRDLSKAPAKQYQPSCALGVSSSDPSPLAAIGGGCPHSCGTGGAEHPSCAGMAAWPKQLVFQERATGKARVIDTAPRHLPTVQMMSYPGVPRPEPFVQDVYGSPWRF